MEYPNKEVFFNQYCKNCVHYEEPETCAACDECLANPSNEWSHKPVRFEEKESQK